MTTDKNRLGMLCFIATETIFFGMLILAYIYFQNNAPNSGPNARNSLNVGLTAFFSLFLFASSGTIWLAERSLHRGNQRGVSLWLVATVVLGLIFLGGQGYEYAKLIGENITVSRNTFGTTFFTLTGFHGLHVFIGLLAIGILAGWVISGNLKGHKSSALGTISLYWHFVDIVWVLLFTIIYLLALL